MYMYVRGDNKASGHQIITLFQIFSILIAYNVELVYVISYLS